MSCKFFNTKFQQWKLEHWRSIWNLYDGKIIEQTVIQLSDIPDDILWTGRNGSNYRNANRVVGCINKFLWNNKYLRSHSKAKVYKLVIRSVLPNGVEVISETSKLKIQVQITEFQVEWALCTEIRKGNIIS